MNQFKMDENDLYEKSDIKLIYVGPKMYVELKHIWQPKPQAAVTPPPTYPAQ